MLVRLFIVNFQLEYTLDDDVAGTANNTETLSFNHTGRALTNEGLVGSNGDTEATSVVT